MNIKGIKRKGKLRWVFFFGLTLWVIWLVAFFVYRLSHLDDYDYYNYVEGEVDWINAPDQSDAPLTEREKLLRNVEEREAQFLQYQEETPEEEDEYIP